MLVADKQDCFVLTTNDDHARIAGQLAQQLNDRLFPYDNRREEFNYAVMEHDRAWINLDEVPIWNDRSARPFSVSDFPLMLRLPHYVNGLAEIESQSAYAALLCSLHYTSFRAETVANLVGGVPPQARAFIAAEKERQSRLTGKLGLSASESAAALLHRLLKWLQSMDELSIWLCMADDTARTDALQVAYRETMRANAAEAETAPDEILLPSWHAVGAASVAPFPFVSPFEVTWKRKEVPKDLIRQEGLFAAYNQSPIIASAITIQP